MKKVPFNRFYFGDRVAWTEMFDSEEELVEKLRGLDVERFKKHCGGYVYIEGFQKTLDSGKDLSKAQMTQLKRLAKEVYRYYLELHTF